MPAFSSWSRAKVWADSIQSWHLLVYSRPGRTDGVSGGLSKATSARCLDFMPIISRAGMQELLSPSGPHRNLLKQGMGLIWGALVGCAEFTSVTKVLYIPFKLPPVEPLVKAAKGFGDSKMFFPGGTMRGFENGLSQRSGGHHLPPIFPCSWLLPGSQQHLITHLQSLNVCVKSLSCS